MSLELATLSLEMDQLWRKHKACRALFPYATEELIGERLVRTGGFYSRDGLDVVCDFGVPLTAERIGEINDVGHYLNQNFVVRLYSLLESYRIISETIKIDWKIDAAADLDILRRLRNRFAHSSGRFDPDDAKHRQLTEKIKSHYGVGLIGNDQFPLPIDRVLEPMSNACKDYAIEFLEKQASR